MDQAIGTVLDTLDKEGLADNTIVLFFSDNGGAAYSVGGADNAPLRGGKGETFEGGIRVISLLRWPASIPAGQKMSQIMSAMDVFPTLAEAAGIEAKNQRPFDGRSMWPAISEGKEQPREDYLFFASEVPIFGHFNLTAFNDEWKLVQEIDQEQLVTHVTNYLFKISDDPHEYNNLADKHPQKVAELSQKIQAWRALHPINGTRSTIAPPPGWRAPLDWASYPRRLSELQAETTVGVAPSEMSLRFLDYAHGQRGRLMYDCPAPTGSLREALTRQPQCAVNGRIPEYRQ
jgi:arylsulfatase A-like enzyme